MIEGLRAIALPEPFRLVSLVLLWQEQAGRGAIRFRDDPDAVITHLVGRDHAEALADGELVLTGVLGKHLAPVARDVAP